MILNDRQWQSKLIKRRKRLLRKFPGDLVLVFSAPEKVRAADTKYPYIQDSTFYYLTGFEEPNSALVLRGGSKQAQSILFAEDKDPLTERWEGARTGLKKLAKLAAVDQVCPWESLEQELPQLIKGCRKIVSCFGICPEQDQLITSLLASPWGPRPDRPVAFEDIRLAVAEQRVVKDSMEISAIQTAVDITSAGFSSVFQNISRLKSETHLAKFLEAEFAAQGSKRTAFPTIVASGKNAACLHHSPGSGRLKKSDLVLIDAGASYLGYSADISRTFPASGKFSEAQAAVYDIVHSALEMSLRACKPGSSLARVHSIAVKQITKGLIELGLLKGTVSSNIKHRHYQKFFMHSTGHWLGLDVHDSAPLSYPKPFLPSSSKDLRLRPGHVFTVEPGIYIDAKDKQVPPEFRGIGIRLEENVLIRRNTYKLLSEDLPISRDEIEGAMQ